MRPRAASILWAGLLACACSSKPAFQTFVSERGGFSVEVPAEWTVLESRPEESPGAQFLAPPPKGKRAVRRYVTVDYYPKGNRDYPDPAAYIDSVASRELSARDVSPASAGGLRGVELRWSKPLPQSPEFAPKGRLLVRTVLLEAPGGFYALGDYVPEGDAGDPQQVFERALATFLVVR